MQKRSLNLIVTSVVCVLFIKCLRMCRGNGDMGFNRTWYVLILHVAESARFNFSAKRHVRLQPSTIVWYLLCINHVTDQHPWQMLTNRHTAPGIVCCTRETDRDQTKPALWKSMENFDWLCLFIHQFIQISFLYCQLSDSKCWVNTNVFKCGHFLFTT